MPIFDNLVDVGSLLHLSHWVAIYWNPKWATLRCCCAVNEHSLNVGRTVCASRCTLLTNFQVKIYLWVEMYAYPCLNVGQILRNHIYFWRHASVHCISWRSCHLFDLCKFYHSPDMLICIFQ